MQIATPIWEDRQLRIWKVEGAVSGVSVGFKELEGVDYYLRVGRNRVRRGTMLGSPSFFEAYDAFYGAVHYKTVDIRTDGGGSLSIGNVSAAKKFEKYISEGRKCTFYMLSPKNASAGDNMVFAIRAGSEQADDIDGLCSIADRLHASIRQQLLWVAVPAVCSIVLLSAIPFSLFGKSFWPFFISLLLFFAGGSAAGLLVLNKALRGSGFPSRAAFKEILSAEGMHL